MLTVVTGGSGSGKSELAENIDVYKRQSGIVEPMSNKAVIETIRTEESMLKAQGRKNLLITIGNCLLYTSRCV